MPQPTDSNYIAVSRHRRPFSTAGRPPILEIVDDAWACETVLPDDDLIIARHEAASSNLLLFAEDEVDGDHTSVPVVTPSTNNAPGGGSGGSNGGGGGGNSFVDRRRREEIWNDLGLDQLINSSNGETTLTNIVSGSSGQRHTSQNQTSQPSSR